MTAREQIHQHRQSCGECQRIERTGKGSSDACFCSALRFLTILLGVNDA